MPLPVRVQPDAPEIVLNLLALSKKYADNHLEDSGMLRDDDPGKPNIRDTALAALLFAELDQSDATEKAWNAVLDSQVLDQGSAQFGNFPVHPGEIPVDDNWSAFIGSYMLVYLARHGDSLAPDIANRFRTAIRAAAAHRLRAHKELHRTNIAILSAFVLIHAGEELADPQLTESGRSFWQDFVRYTRDSGIAEYNSPNYFRVDLYGLGFITDYVWDKDIIADANQLRLLFWWSITQHYHPPTLQLAGPFSRSYTDRMLYEMTAMQSFLYRESGGKISLSYSSDAKTTGDDALHAVLPALVHASWPDLWVEQALAAHQAAREFQERTMAFKEDGADYFQQITTYLDPRMTLGTANKERSGPLQRPLIAHAIDPTTGEVGVFKIAISGSVTTTFVMAAQKANSALVVVSADTYSVLANPALNVQLQWYGGTASMPTLDNGTPPSSGKQSNITWMNMPVTVRFADPLSSCPCPVTYAYRTSSSASLLNLEIQASLPVTPSYRTANQLAAQPVIFGIYFDDADKPSPSQLAPIIVDIAANSDTATIRWNAPNGQLAIEYTLVPGRWGVRQWIDGRLVTAEPLAPVLP